MTPKANQSENQAPFSAACVSYFSVHGCGGGVMCMRGKGNDHWTLLLLVGVVLSWGRRMKKMIRWSFSPLVCLPPFSFQQSSSSFVEEQSSVAD